MPHPEIARDERAVALENASYRLADQLLTFGVLASVAYRAYALVNASWDSLALVFVAGGHHRRLSERAPRPHTAGAATRGDSCDRRSCDRARSHVAALGHCLESRSALHITPYAPAEETLETLRGCVVRDDAATEPVAVGDWDAG